MKSTRRHRQRWEPLGDQQEGPITALPHRRGGGAIPRFVFGGLSLVALGLGAPEDWAGPRSDGPQAGVPYLCLTLRDEAELPEGLRITRANPASFGPPVGYNEVPSSLVPLGGTKGPIPLPGRHPVGLRVSENRDLIELLDRHRGELVQVDAGGVISVRQLPIDSADQLVGGVWDGDRWHVLTRNEAAAWSVLSFASLDGPLAVSSVPLPEAAHVQIGAAGGQVVLIEFDAPHRVLAMDPDHRAGWRKLGEVDFKGVPSGRTVALVPLAVGNLVLITLVDQASAARTVRLMHVLTGSFRDSRMDIPMAIVSVDPSGWLYAIRETRGRELLTFSWSLSERQCVPEPQPTLQSRR